MALDLGTQPFAFNKDLGAPVTATGRYPTQADSDGNPVIPLTQEQKYIFDTKGWLLVPGVSADEIEPIKAFISQLHHEPKSLPPYKRSPLGGATQALSDHPVTLGFLNEFVHIVE